MKISDKASSIFWLVFALYICFESLRLPLGTFSEPGAGFLPLGSGIILGILATLQLWEAHRQKMKGEEAFSIDLKRLKNVLFVLAALLVYAVALHILGFMITTFFFLLFLLRLFQAKKWIVAIGISAIAAYLSHLLFEIWLRAQLPKGIFGI